MSRWRLKTNAALSSVGLGGDRTLSVLAIAVGAATGQGAHLFYELLEFGFRRTLKPVRRDVHVGRIADLTILKRVQADQVRMVTAPIIHPGDPLQELQDLAGAAEAHDFVMVDDDNEYVGMVVAEDIKTALLQPEAVPLLLVDELTRLAVSGVTTAETLNSVLDKFARARVDALPAVAVAYGSHVSGVITRQAVMDRYQQELEKLSQSPPF